MIKRTRFIYGALAVIWVVLLVWQIAEHDRFWKREREGFRKRAQYVSTTATAVMRSQQRFGGWTFRERLEPALTSIIKSGEVSSILVLNEVEEVLASAGTPFDVKLLDASGEYWSKEIVALANLVDLGTNLTSEATLPEPPRVLPERPAPPPPGTVRTNEPPGADPQTNPGSRSNAPPSAASSTDRGEDRGRQGRGGDNRNRPGPGEDFRGRRDGPGFRRPPGMSEEDYRAMLQRQGVHSFVIVLPTAAVRARTNGDFWLRSLITLLGSVAVVGLGMAWRNLSLSSELEVRLVRASELNARLKEMNLAAAGLAHETRNPLNIIRGLAQMISRQQDASPEVRAKTREILDEADRVTAQLNEFINYSRPREVRRTNVSLGSVVGEVVRALNFDIEEKLLRVEVQNNLPTIAADEQLLRQALFNLLLNATQAVDRGGEIHVTAEKVNGSEIVLDIRDNGPGVMAEQRKEIFKPYFTTNQQGTGLGLAVVQQIVLAHGWEIECSGNEPRGAVFRISHMRSATQA